MEHAARRPRGRKNPTLGEREAEEAGNRTGKIERVGEERRRVGFSAESAISKSASQPPGRKLRENVRARERQLELPGKLSRQERARFHRAKYLGAYQGAYHRATLR